MTLDFFLDKGCHVWYEIDQLVGFRLPGRFFIRLRRRPRLRGETFASMVAFGEDVHSGVQAQVLPVDECGLRS